MIQAASGGERQGARQNLKGVVADVVVAHFGPDHVLGDNPFLQVFAQQTEEEILLVGSGWGL